MRTPFQMPVVAISRPVFVKLLFHWQGQVNLQRLSIWSWRLSCSDLRERLAQLPQRVCLRQRFSSTILHVCLTTKCGVHSHNPFVKLLQVFYSKRLRCRGEENWGLRSVFVHDVFASVDAVRTIPSPATKSGPRIATECANTCVPGRNRPPWLA